MHETKSLPLCNNKTGMTPKFHSLRIADIRHETEDTLSIAFDVPETLQADYAFHAGQYLTLKAQIDGEEVRRSYSLCSAPHENEWRVAIKQVEGGKFSTYANATLAVGQDMEVMTPTGNFSVTPDNNNDQTYVLFAAGSGITPILSIAKTLLKEESNSSIHLFFGNKGFGSIIFREEIEALKNSYMDRFRVVHILSRENLGNEIQKGRITAEKCDSLFTAFLKNEQIKGIYTCGPEEMILGVKESMTRNGVSEKLIHFELFGTNISKKSKTETSTLEIDSNVTVILDGDSIDISLISGESILDAAQKAGADLPFACKGGVCCTCKAKIIKGTARMDVNYALEKDEVEAGYILTCQAHPTSEKLIVSFDE